MYVLVSKTYPNADVATYGVSMIVLGIFDTIQNMEKHKIEYDPGDVDEWCYYEVEVNKFYQDLNQCCTALTDRHQMVQY